MMGDDRSVEAYSKRDDVPEGVLIRHLLTPTPRAGLVAAARARELPGWAASHITSLALDRSASVASNRACQPLALYALGTWAARRRGSADPSVASLIDAALGDSLCDESPAAAPLGIGANATLLALAVVGHLNQISEPRGPAGRTLCGGQRAELVITPEVCVCGNGSTPQGCDQGRANVRETASRTPA
jgi:hypothetical protein